MKISNYLQILKNMGLEYVLFRTQYELKRKLRILEIQFPTKYEYKQFISLEEWKKKPNKFFFESRESLSFLKNPNLKLKEEYENYLEGKLKFFNAEYFDLGKNYDWITNPLTHFKYDLTKHCTKINDIDPVAGDIKYVWEKSRFSFLYLIMRYDYHFNFDSSQIVFNEIISWIDSNPFNMGPNYKCSQEISLRILNWTFALYYYKNSPNLTEEIFYRIVNSINQQLKHIYTNINFSRKTVRNNHAITETLMLFLSGILFPFLPASKIWMAKGKVWFEEEIDYQIYEDGTHLQFSMNYHRVVIQLLTWALLLAKKNNISLDSKVLKKAKLSLNFLENNLIESNGFLPNYGANDGALFFKYNNCAYRDYRPQLNALSYAIDETIIYEDQNSIEDIYWYGSIGLKSKGIEQKKINHFDNGGYYSIRDNKSFTFIKCGGYKDRPSHADNLHLDIWVDDENIFRDGGSYLYNTSEENIKYFNGSLSHNTIMLGDNDQMLKGPRFIWYYWTQAIYKNLIEENDCIVFEGEIKAFTYLNSNITHKRTVKKYKDNLKWEITDRVSGKGNLPINQIWNVPINTNNKYEITAFNLSDEIIKPVFEDGWFSQYYGVKKKSKQIIFSTDAESLKTIIEVI